MHVNQSTLNGMLKNIKDPALRETYGSIINGDFPYKVFCLKPGLNSAKKPKHPAGLLIGYIDNKGRCVEEVTVDKKTHEPVGGLASSRDRFDGRKGFSCWCGNSSILAEEEKPVMQATAYPTPPTQDDLLKIHGNLQANKAPMEMVFTNGASEYDGFRVEEAK